MARKKESESSEETGRQKVLTILKWWPIGQILALKIKGSCDSLDQKESWGEFLLTDILIDILPINPVNV